MKRFVFLFISFFIALNCLGKTRLSMSELIAQSKSGDWRPLDPANTLYLELKSGRVIIELAPGFAPKHVENVKKLAQEKYWDGLAIVRAQDNYVVQWADPNSSDAAKKKVIKTGKATLDAEFETAWDSKKSFVKLKDGDIYAPEVGFVDGFPVARDLKTKKGWLLHCYGAVGAGRDNASDSGGGTELYAVTGHAPRHLDRNVTLIGRVISGMELLSSLPRGKAAMGFYDKTEQPVAIKSLHLASDIPEADRTQIEVMKTDSKIFQDVIESRRHRPEEWFKYRADRIEICNVPIPVRTK
ncbi:MAG: peptidylprolyl isomerase [Bdellovibrionaceae bacterium]|nr:peptidylprolyl isomerase [Pseudobdellovibrionaceae bacterium]